LRGSADQCADRPQLRPILDGPEGTGLWTNRHPDEQDVRSRAQLEVTEQETAAVAVEYGVPRPVSQYAQAVEVVRPPGTELGKAVRFGTVAVVKHVDICAALRNHSEGEVRVQPFRIVLLSHAGHFDRVAIDSIVSNRKTAGPPVSRHISASPVHQR
jgi:hypothetical protein